MKNFFLTFSLALLVVFSAVSTRHSVTGIGGSPVPIPPNAGVRVTPLGIGGSPVPIPPNP